MRYYKFYSNKNQNIESITKFRLFASLPDNLNDPFEGLIGVPSIEFKPHAEEIISRIKTRRCICCLSHSESKSFVEESIQMWAFYANNHKGFCVEFNESILEGLTELKENSNEEDVKTTEDVYADVQYGLNLLYVPNTFQGTFEAALCHKETKWEIEQETRLIFRYPPINNGYMMKKGKGILIPIKKRECSINSIYLGCRATKIVSNALRKFAAKYNIPCYMTYPSPDSYRLCMTIL